MLTFFGHSGYPCMSYSVNTTDSKNDTIEYNIYIYIYIYNIYNYIYI